MTGQWHGARMPKRARQPRDLAFFFTRAPGRLGRAHYFLSSFAVRLWQRKYSKKIHIIQKCLEIADKAAGSRGLHTDFSFGPRASGRTQEEKKHKEVDPAGGEYSDIAASFFPLVSWPPVVPQRIDSRCVR
nr:hypothetical protein [Pandoravirus massiliensis]